MAEPGSVAWQFARKGVVTIPSDVNQSNSLQSNSHAVTEDDLMLVVIDAGAEDMAESDGAWRVFTQPGDIESVSQALTEAEISFQSADVTMVPTTTVPIEDEAVAKKVLDIIDLLDN